MAEFWGGYLWPGIIIVGQILLIIVPIMGGVAYLTLAERKVIAAMQLRKGPNVVGPFGLFQQVADGGIEFRDGKAGAPISAQDVGRRNPSRGKPRR